MLSLSKSYGEIIPSAIHVIKKIMMDPYHIKINVQFGLDLLFKNVVYHLSCFVVEFALDIKE